MARIRSIHPGLFTDEAFMTASPHARLLIIGIWCEAWDDGVFEWKPLTLKARLFPVDAVSVPDLLAELVTLDFVRQFEASGKQYGAIRNFQKFQRPKKPNSSGVMPAQLSTYVGSGSRSSEEVPNQFPTSGEKSPQMEDGGGEEEETEGATAPSSGAGVKVDYDEIEHQCRTAAGLENDPASGLLVIGPIIRLLEAGATLERDILPVLRAAKVKGQRGSTWAYYLPAIERGMKPPDAIKHISPPSNAAPLVFVKVGTEEWDEWQAHKGKKLPFKYYAEHQAEGWLFPSAHPPTPSQSKDRAA
jgi:hypothetical protein